MIDIMNSVYAEAIYFYVSQADIWNDFINRQRDENMSMAEYVMKYHLNDFENWVNENGIV